MKNFFEIKYLEVNWYDKETVTKITESLTALDVLYDEEKNIFQAETTIYPKIEGVKHGVLAIRFLNNRKSKPYIKTSSGKIKYLSSIVDPNTRITWWIVKEEWDEKYRKWTSIAPNLIGTLQFILQGKLCEVILNGSDFTLEQLDQYLSIFKNDLWELILDENSSTEVKVKEKESMYINESLINYIAALVFHSRKILETPKVELREIQTLKPRKEVKPVNRTFMELTTKTNQRLLTSRASEPSYNTADNRYILFILERCYRIIKQIVLLARNKNQRFLRMIEKFQVQYNNFTDYIKVNRDLVVADLERLKERKNLSYWQKEFAMRLSHYQFLSPYTSKSRDLYLLLEKPTKDEDGFFVQVYDYNKCKWTKPNDKPGILSLRNYSKLVNSLETGMILKFTGDYKYRDEQKIVKFWFNAICSIELYDFPEKIKKAEMAFIKEREEGIKLNGSNWERKLSLNDRREQEKEKNTLRNRIEFYTLQQKSSCYIFEKINPKLILIKEIINKLKLMNIKASSYFPNSMTFVQNPHYQSVYNSYKKLRESINLQDEDLLLSLEEVDNIGLVNMPLIYERWSLLQIILVLKNVFRFIPQGDWKNKLINAIKDNQKNIEIYLHNEQARRYIVLTYEKELDNGKRPDFTLDLIWFEINNNDDGGYNRREKRFILDAKFYDKSTFDKAGGMMSKIEELYTKKNYSESGNNPVFLIHPCKNLIDKPVTAQSWGKYSFLGEVNISNDSVFSAHNKGAIYLNPVDQTLYNDELQRLLGLFLQYKLEDENISHQETDITTAIPICIQCGSNYFQQMSKNSQRTLRSVWLRCCECEQWQVYNHCSNHHRLIKNGVYWTYHSARAIEPVNVKCPICGEWGGG